jgi:hypothetical protein
MIHSALWITLTLILFAVFVFVRSQKQKWDRERRWRDYCARVEAQHAEAQWRRAQQVGNDLLNTLEKIDAGLKNHRRLYSVGLHALQH